MLPRRPPKAAAALLAIGLALALAALTVPGAGASSKKTIGVQDDYYSPIKLTVRSGTTVAWKWASYNGDVHDVKLRKGPGGVKSFHSASAVNDYSFSRKLTVKGTYSFICTHHTNMVVKVVVK